MARPKKTPSPQSAPSGSASMDITLLKDITKLMKDNDLIEVDVETSALKLKLRKQGAATASVVQAIAAAPVAAPAPAPAAPVAAAPKDEFANCIKIISPIPGTAYLKPSPDASVFAPVGTPVDESKVVCLIEAMKVFNEIKPDAGVKGVIKKVCVTDGQPVEYGTVLFLVG